MDLAEVVSPPTRGWTPVMLSRLERKFGGVSPPTRGWTPGSSIVAACRYRRFPRPRGDGPVRVPSGCRGIRSGFPAHAGMDPPTLLGILVGGSAGFPAHAGMDPGNAGADRRSQPRFPRPRGDGPSRNVRSTGQCHAGWFPRPRGDGPDIGPEHVVRGRRWRFPRPRGDGPKGQLYHRRLRHRSVSPPTRGWTL